ncbi:hypothetical protein EHS25_004079 [Saitozyma podzolica]|uniref:Uncharacterized protein n=1 Tax=Saitozyma podzolica TaxID=1890683 RepID=A0A427YTB7_9TREE|nr:hypothetical protein EHS25_004079 [Saitozyma podzolica]
MSQGWVNNEVSYDDLHFTTDPSEIVKAAKDICDNEPRQISFNFPWHMSQIQAFEDMFQSEGTEKPVFVYSTSTRMPRGYAYSKKLMLFGFSGDKQLDQSAINLHFGSLAGDGAIRTESMSLDEPRSLSASIWESLDLKERPRKDERSPVQNCFLPIIADNFSKVLERIEELGDDFLIAPNTHRFLQHLAESGHKVGDTAESRLYKMHADIYPPPDDYTAVPRASNPVLTAFAVRGDYVLSASRPLNVFTGDGNGTVLAFWHVDAAEIHTMCRKTSLDNSGPWESTTHDLLDQSGFVDEESRQRFKEVASDLGATLEDELINGGAKAGLLHQAFHGLQGCPVQTVEDTEWVKTDADGKQTAGYFVDPNESVFTAPVRAKGRPEE